MSRRLACQSCFDAQFEVAFEGAGNRTASFAPSAAAVKAAASTSGTVPVTDKALDATLNPSSTFSKVTVALTSSFHGGIPAQSRRTDKAMQKHDAWAAAISSSGLVFPLDSSVRAAQDGHAQVGEHATGAAGHEVACPCSFATLTVAISFSSKCYLVRHLGLSPDWNDLENG